ncbi:MAG: hypothetical protein GT601_05900 [Acidaminobacter sp.]|uniref:hypothetical protein n=1 Tax=Acidaminobacter sp. TaxID=1872102 RepID=UPI001385B9D7|nr:hypothetical protein [Acidaminobacter sp.]MZQ97189.1 hypothetical protein [Acidaminobacter sp.]
MIEYLGIGPEEARTRQDLVDITGYPDRLIRDQISKLRKSGVPVVNFGKGYYISEDPAEIRKFIRIEYWSKMHDMRETASVLYDVAGVMEA